MAEDWGVKISKTSNSATNIPTETTKKNFVILSNDATHKVSTQGVVSSDSNITHSLGFIPFWDAYILENSLTEAHPANGYWNSSWDISSDGTYLYCNEISGSNSLFYIIYLEEA